MDAHIERHQPLITARLIFGPREFPPPPIITARMEFPSIGIPQHRERSITPNPMTSGKRASTPKRHSTPRRTSTPKRNATPQPSTPESNMIVDTTPKRAATPKRHATPQRGATPSTARRRGTSVAFEDMGSPLSGLSDEEDELDSEGDIETSKKIPKPQGEVGRPHSGGYSLQEALDWNDKTYDSVNVLVHKLAKTRLNTAKSFRAQDKKAVKQICDAVRKEYGILKDYEQDWPTRDMLKLHLKYTSQASRRSASRHSIAVVM